MADVSIQAVNLPDIFRTTTFFTAYMAVISIPAVISLNSTVSAAVMEKLKNCKQRLKQNEEKTGIVKIRRIMPEKRLQAEMRCSNTIEIEYNWNKLIEWKREEAGL